MYIFSKNILKYYKIKFKQLELVNGYEILKKVRCNLVTWRIHISRTRGDCDRKCFVISFLISYDKEVQLDGIYIHIYLHQY